MKKIIAYIFGALTFCSLASASQALPCKSWLVSGVFNIPLKDSPVKFSNTIAHGCTNENVGYYSLEWAPIYEGREYVLKISSLDFPEQKGLIDKAILSRAEEGLNKNDLGFYRDQVIPKLEAGLKEEAKILWKDALIQNTI